MRGSAAAENIDVDVLAADGLFFEVQTIPHLDLPMTALLPQCQELVIQAVNAKDVGSVIVNTDGKLPEILKDNNAQGDH